MILDGQVVGRPLISYKDTQTAIEALTGVVAGMTAYATDTALTGYYTGSAWVWLTNTSGSYVPIVHDIAGSYHSTSGRTTGQVLQATGATSIGWSTYALTISGTSTINGSLVGNITGGGTLATGGFTGTIPEAMTFAGRNVANTFTAVQTITAGSSTALTGGFIFTQTKTNPASGVYKFVDLTGTIALSNNAAGAQDFYMMNAIIQTASDAVVYSSANLRSFYLSPRHYGSGTLGQAIGGYVDIYDLGAGTINLAIGYTSIIRNNATGSGRIVNARNFWIQNGVNTGTAADNQYGVYADSLTTATNNYLLYGAGLGRVRVGDDVSIVGGVDRTQLTVTGFSTQTNTLAQFTRNDGNTNAVVNMLMATVNTTGTAAAGFGGSIALNLESSTTADQAAAALEWSWATATHAIRKARVVGKVYDTAARTWIQVDTDGSTSDVLINSLIYGSMYGDDISQLVTVDASSTYYEVGGSLTGGNVNGMTFQNSKELLVTVAGKYLVTWSMSLSAGNNDHLEGAVMINSTVAPSTENAAHTPGAGDQVPVGGSGILTLAVNDLVKLCVENETDTDDITVSHATLTALRIGE